MSDFSAFFARNKKKHDNLKYVASQDFVDANGKPIEWEIKRLSARDDEQIRRAATKQIKIRNGSTRSEMDTNVYLRKLTVAAIAYPNLNDAALQNEYDVMGADDLLMEMLTPGEYAELSTKVTEFNGFNVSMQELVDEAKN